MRFSLYVLESWRFSPDSIANVLILLEVSTLTYSVAVSAFLSRAKIVDTN